MALAPCPECQKEVSTDAKTCPQCGYRLSKKHGGGCGTVLAVGGVAFIGLVILADLGRKSEKIVKPCQFYAADDAVERMLKEEIFYRIDEGDDFPRIYVNDVWYALPFEQKIKLDALLQCHFGRGKGDKLGVYRDHRTGKEVASTGGITGFEMK